MLKIFAHSARRECTRCILPVNGLMRAYIDVPDATAPCNTLRYVYGICLTWLINSPSMAWSSCATPEFRSGRTSGDPETFTSHVTYTSCDVDTLRTSSQRCHSCVTFVWYGCGRTYTRSCTVHRWTAAAMRGSGRIKKPPPRLHIDGRILFAPFGATLHEGMEFRELRELHVTGLVTFV